MGGSSPLRLRNTCRSSKINLADRNARVEREKQRRTVRDAITSCTACSLANERTQAVPFYAARYPATLVIVGEAPGAAEDKAGEPFVGASGKKLDRMLERAGTKRINVFICNTVSCRPPANRTPAESEIEACSGHFAAQLALSGAWVGVLLGDSAYRRVHPTSKLAISRARGIPFWHEGRVWVPTFHPAYGLRNPSALPIIQADIALAVGIANGDRTYPLIDSGVTRVDENEIRSQLDKRGWVAVYARKLEAHIVCVRDDQVKVPRKIALPRYTVDELVHIGQISHHPSPAPDVLRAIHLVKTELGGEIV